MIIIYSFNKDPFNDLIKLKEKKDTKSLTYLIILLVLYFLFSSGVNVYKVYCNVIYTPMAYANAIYFFNPIFIIYFFIDKNDLNKNGFYFIISEIISIFMNFFGAVNNEYIILFFCGLDYDTKYAISKRALEREITYSLDAEKDGYIIKNEEKEKILLK